MARFNNSIVLYVTLFAFLLVANSANAFTTIGTEFEVDSIKYRITSEYPDYVGVCGCDRLLTVANIPQTVKFGNKTYQVKEILSYSFRQFNLCKVYIPDGVTKICENAFGSNYSGVSLGRPKLSFVSIGASVETIEQGAFDKCTDLVEFMVSPDNPKYDSRDNCKALIETATNTLIKGGAETTIPTSVVAIADRAFIYNKRLISIHIPKNVKEIGKEAFFRCGNLKSVTIEGEVSSLPYRVFRECFRLETVNLPLSLQMIGVEAFWECNSLQEVTIPDHVTIIADKAFGGIYDYNGASFPINEINDYDDALSPNKLSLVTIGASVQALDGAFDYCPNLTSFFVSAENTRYDSRDNCKAVIETTTNTLVKGAAESYVPESVVAISPNAFVRCHGLDTITIPEGVCSIGEYAFHECLGLKQVNYNAINCDFKANEDLSYDMIYYSEYHKGKLSPFTYMKDQIHPHIYSPYVYPVSVILGPKVERLPAYLLNKQSNFISINLPQSLRFIEDYALANTCLKYISLPQKVQTIGTYAMYNTSLTSITLPDSLRVIGDYAFADTGIKRVTLPESMVSLGLAVFNNAPLTRLTSLCVYPPICAVDMSKGVHSLSGLNYTQCELLVPGGSIDIYRSAFPWNQFENMMEISEEPKSRDLNCDGIVDIADLNIVINLMLGKGDDNVSLDLADVNDDGVVDVADLNMVINTMLGKDLGVDL